MTTETIPDERNKILQCLASYAAQRPGLEFGNYGNVPAYRSEMRSITRDLQHARVLLNAVRWRNINAEDLKHAMQHAYSGRLTWEPFHTYQCTRVKSHHWNVAATAEQPTRCVICHRGHISASVTRGPLNARLSYCTGQYWPTEYRRAVCAVLASALWEHARSIMPDGTLHHNSETGETLTRYNGKRAGDYLRDKFKEEFGRAIAKRWFD